MRHEAYLSSPREPVKEEEEKWAADRLKCASCRSGFSNEFIAMLLLCAGKDGLKSDAPMRLDARRISLAISAIREVYPRLQREREGFFTDTRRNATSLRLS